MRRIRHRVETAVALAVLTGCGGTIDTTQSAPVEARSSAQLSKLRNPGANPSRPLARPCDQLVTSLQYPNTSFTAAADVPAGALKQSGRDIPAHCLLTGKMFERTSLVDGKTYAIGFEMRLPLEWNGRFFYQANGGLDGNVVPATGDVSGGGALTSALLQGFAVISSDAGHTDVQNPTFGIDPRARLDYGYRAVGKLTPMAKSVIHTAYRHKPDYSYIGGCSNGGRHAMVAAARYADQYDGYLVGAPGFHLPRAAVASIYSAQQYAPLAVPGAVIPTGPYAGLPDLSGAFTQTERQLLSDKVLQKCDALDGLADGMVQDTWRCQGVFNLETDVPTCPGPRDGTCLAADQKAAIANIFAGGVTSYGSPIYTRFPFDFGHAAGGTYFWEFISPLILDSSAVGYVFGTPPVNPATFIPPLFSLTGSVDLMVASIQASDATYTESAETFMVPPDLSLNAVKENGGRMIVYHGVSDPIFSAADTVQWLEGVHQSAPNQNVARLYLVPGMNHCSGGPATDQFDLLRPLVRWVEQDEPPRQVTASVRGPGNPGGSNPELPPNWSADRTRPLCPFPRVAVYLGGDSERAESFACR
jgi:hypothetical protein